MKSFREQIWGRELESFYRLEKFEWIGEQIMYIFFPFMFGIYPYAEVTAKQKNAMKDANVDFRDQTIYEVTYNCLLRLLKDY